MVRFQREMGGRGISFMSFKQLLKAKHIFENLIKHGKINKNRIV